MSADILVIAPHGDDEILGVGGHLAKCVDNGQTVSICIITSPWEPEWSKDFIEQRQHEIENAHEILGVKTTRLGLPAANLESNHISTIANHTLKLIETMNPEIMFVPHRGDLHLDHQIVHDACLVAARPQSGVKTILAYETLSETEWGVIPFVPNIYSDITKTLARKIEAFKAYKGEIREGYHPRRPEIIEALAKKRGSEVMVKYAEAFMLIRGTI